MSSVWKDDLTQDDKPSVTQSILPHDYSTHVPAIALKWLLQFGLPWTYWRGQIGWASANERLIFKVGSPHLFSIGRYIPTTNTVDENRKKWYTWGEVHKAAIPIGSGPNIVLTEDLISAHKVGQVTEALPLFGTQISPAHLYYLRNAGKPILYWLDKDQEEYMPKRASNLSLLADLPVEYIVTEDDPKKVSLEGIRSLLSFIQ